MKDKMESDVKRKRKIEKSRDNQSYKNIRGCFFFFIDLVFFLHIVERKKFIGGP